MPSLTVDIKPGGNIEKRILEGVRDRVNFSKRKWANRHSKWIADEEAALAYLPEKSIDATRRTARENSGKPQYTTIVMPYSYGVLMASHTYWTTVFMSRAPIMQYAGRHGETEMQIQALEALVDYQIQVGEMMVPWYVWLLDLGKYGQGVIGQYWENKISVIAEMREVEKEFFGIKTGVFTKKKFTSEVKGYEGNKIYNVRPFDFFPDPRVPLSRFQEGEFCAAYIELGWNTVLRRRDQGYYGKKAVARIQSKHNQGGHSTGSYGDASSGRAAGSSQLELPNSDELFGELNARKAQDLVKGYECHIELIPKVWGLGKSDRLENWVFTVTSNFETLLGAQPVGAIHNKFPFHVMELEPEGYAIAGRGLPEILDPVQRTMDWLVNSHFYNVRKTLNNQFIVDPSRIVMKDVLDPLPGGTIRAKPAAYGTNMRDAIHQFNVVDVTQNHLRDIAFMNEVGQRATGVNDQILGLLNAGGSSRKTATEVRGSNTFGTNRLKTTSEYASAMGWTPMSQMIVQNSQQYYDAEKKFRLVGDLAEQAGQKFVQVDPDTIQGFYDFVPIDGTLPVDRFAQANLWRELFGQMRNFPQLMEQYDIPKIFGWVAQLAGLKNIQQFKINIQPDEQINREAERGNLVPLRGGDATNRNLNAVPAGQVGTGPVA